MKNVSVADIQQDFPTYLHLVRDGETVVITDEGIPLPR
jgi:antitoxin (DNA-binding transcriptional repressor) of toxin-antitoxin stability system